MLVADTSAVLGAILGRPLRRRLTDRLGAEDELHAPHVIDVEVLHALRRMVRLGTLPEREAAGARRDFADVKIVRYPHGPLADRMWELRHNLSAYDAAYVALAEALDAPLVTSDARLAAAPGHDATVELYEREP